MKRGFTLIELLVAASLTVVIAVLSTSIFLGVGQLQITRRNTQAHLASISAVQASLSADIQNARFPGDRYIKPNLTVVGSQALIVRIAAQTSDQVGEWRVYCLSPYPSSSDNRGVSLKAFRITSNSSFSGAAAVSVTCTASGIGALFGLATTVVDSWLSDSVTNFKTLTFAFKKQAVSGSAVVQDAIEYSFTATRKPSMTDPLNTEAETAEVAVQATLLPENATQTSIQAKRTTDFINSIGINTGWGESNNHYHRNDYSVSSPFVVSGMTALRNLGVLHIRDTMSKMGDANTPVMFSQKLAALNVTYGGVDVALVMNGSGTNHPTMGLIFPKIWGCVAGKDTSGCRGVVAGKVFAFESLEEPESCLRGWAGATSCRRFIQHNPAADQTLSVWSGSGYETSNFSIANYATLRHDWLNFTQKAYTASCFLGCTKSSQRVPLIGPAHLIGSVMTAEHGYPGASGSALSETMLNDYRNDASVAYRSYDGITNFANLHTTYLKDPGNSNPDYASTTEDRLNRYAIQTWVAPLFPNQPIIVTESGYSSAVHGQTGQAKLVERMLFTNYNAGIWRTYLNELIDDQGVEGMGIMTDAPAAKRAYTTLQNLIAKLKDSNAAASSFGPGQLNFTVSGGSSLRYTLLQKATQEYQLAIWNEVPYVAKNGPDQNLNNVTVTVPAAYKICERYRPLDNTDVRPNASQTTFNLPDDVMVLTINKTCSGAGPINPPTPYPITIL